MYENCFIVLVIVFLLQSFCLFFRAAITMFVSAYWHGIHPGYYLSMLTTVPAMIAEDMMAKAFKNSRAIRQQLIFDYLCWFMRCRIFDYMCMGFLLLTLHDTCRYWGSIYYIGHCWTVAFIIIGYLCAPSKRKTKQQTEIGIEDKKIE